MNTVVSEVRLFRHLALTPYVWFQIGFCLLATVMALETEGWARWGYPLFLAVFLLNIRVEWENYRAMGMTRLHWRRHRQILVSITGGIVLLEMLLIVTLTDLSLNVLLLVAVPAAWVLTMVRRAEPSRTLEEIIKSGKSEAGRDTAGKSDEKRSRFPMTPVHQIIRGPQISMWLIVWGIAAFAVAVSGVLSWLFGMPSTWLSVIVPLLAVPATWLAMGQIGISLREWITLGGNRGAWARETAVLGLLSPLIAGVLVVIVGAVFNFSVIFDTLPLMLGVALLVPVLFTLLELTDLSCTWWVSLTYVGLGGGLVVLWATDSIGNWSFLIGSALLYLVHSLTLPVVARNYTVFGGGLGAWLGLRSGANA